MVNGLLMWSHSRGCELTFRKQEKAAAVKKVLDSLIHNGNWKYTKVFFFQLWIHVEEDSELRSLNYRNREFVSMLNTIFIHFPLRHVENAMLKCEDPFGFENCTSAVSECASRKVQDCWKLILVFRKKYFLWTWNVLLLGCILTSIFVIINLLSQCHICCLM